MITASRYHDISTGHRVYGHEGKCKYLHGHNYRVHFTCEADALDAVGRVIDFSVIKERLCMWLENNWDHKMVLWDNDPLKFIDQEVVWVPFNPTAENMAEYLLHTIGPQQLEGTNVRLVRVVIEETAKCSVEARL